MITYNIKCGQVHSGVWKWKNKKDFINYLRLMHNENAVQAYQENPEEFNAIYHAPKTELLPERYENWHYSRSQA